MSARSTQSACPKPPSAMTSSPWPWVGPCNHPFGIIIYSPSISRKPVYVLVTFKLGALGLLCEVLLVCKYFWNNFRKSWTQHPSLWLPQVSTSGQYVRSVMGDWTAGNEGREKEKPLAHCSDPCSSAGTHGWWSHSTARKCILISRDGCLPPAGWESERKDTWLCKREDEGRK